MTRSKAGRSPVGLARETIDLMRVPTGYECPHLAVKFIIVLLLMQSGDKRDGPETAADLRDGG